MKKSVHEPGELPVGQVVGTFESAKKLGYTFTPAIKPKKKVDVISVQPFVIIMGLKHNTVRHRVQCRPDEIISLRPKTGRKNDKAYCSLTIREAAKLVRVGQRVEVRLENLNMRSFG